MPVTLCGIIYYTDEPKVEGGRKKGEIFSVVYPEFDDSELDGPPTDGERRHYCIDEDGETRRHHPHERPTNSTFHTWLSLNAAEPGRTPVMEKVPKDDPRVTGFDPGAVKFDPDQGGFRFNEQSAPPSADPDEWAPGGHANELDP